jgi:MFS transporter, ACS family, hexuronate transporter
VNPTIGADRYRWWILTVFVLSSAINYLDRQSLATLAPLLRADFHLSREQYGWILGAFSITYAASAPFAGIIVDRIGLNRGISLAVGLWSAAGIATGFSTGLGGLVGCRAVLGIAEAGGIPSAGKAIHTYLAAARARHGQRHQSGRRQPRHDSRAAHRHVDRGPLRMAHGVRAHRHSGLLWIPVWNFAARHSPPAAKSATALKHGEMLRDRRLWAFVAANGLSMVGYSLWSNWTTQYLVDVHHLTVAQAAWYTWIPPLVAMGGGFAGGWFSLRLMDRGVPATGGAFPRLLRGCPALAGHSRHSASSHRGLDHGRHFAQHLRGIGVQRQYLHAAARCVRWRARRLRGVDARGFLRRHPTGHLAALRPHHRSPRLRPRHHHRGAHPHGGLRGAVGIEVGGVKQRLKQWIFRLLGKDPEAVVVTFCSGDAELCRRMADEVRTLVPDRRHFVATEENWPKLRRELRNSASGSRR